MSSAILGAALCAVLAVAPARAALIEGSTQAIALAPQYFTAAQAAAGGADPSFTYNNVPGYGTLSISYGPYFEGQTATDPLHPPTFVSGSPAGPLALALNEPVQAPPGDDPATDPNYSDYPYSYKTVVEPDATLQNTFVLGGVPGQVSGNDLGVTNGFGGPIAILFSIPVVGVQLTVGSFDAIGQTQIEGFLADGTSVGSITNTSTGFETFDLSDDTPGESLSGVLLTTTDAGGIGINGVGVLEPAPVAVPGPRSTVILPAIILLLLIRNWRHGVRLVFGDLRRAV